MPHSNGNPIVSAAITVRPEPRRQLGDRVKAKAYYAKLLGLTKNADTQRPEMQRAKAYARG